MTGARTIGDKPLDVAGVAAHTGHTPATLRSYIRDGKMPPADGKMGQSLWWWQSTIDHWRETQAGRGRPRNAEGLPGKSE